MIIKELSKNKNGFTLLETLVAISVFTFGILGPMALVSYSIHSASAAKEQTVAFYLAEEAMEYIRKMRDDNGLSGAGNWLQKLANCQSNGCIVDVHESNENQRLRTFPGGNCTTNYFVRYNNTTGQYTQNTSDQLTTFCRVAVLEPNFGGRAYEARVTVTIKWLERNRTKTFVTQEHIYDWK